MHVIESDRERRRGKVSPSLSLDLRIVDVHLHVVLHLFPGDPQGRIALQLGGYRVPQLLDRQGSVR